MQQRLHTAALGCGAVGQQRVTPAGRAAGTVPRPACDPGVSSSSSHGPALVSARLSHPAMPPHHQHHHSGSAGHGSALAARTHTLARATGGGHDGSRPSATRRTLHASASSQPQAGVFGDPNTVAGMLMAYAMQLQQQQAQPSQAGQPHGAAVVVEGLTFHPPGAEKPLLENANMQLTPNSLGLVIGRSGSGKTTLLQVLAGLTEQTAGSIAINRPVAVASTSGNGNGRGSRAGRLVPTSIEERMQQVGLVFQFPERHFLGEDLLEELTFAWPRLPQYWQERQQLGRRVQEVLQAVGLEDIPVDVPPVALSGGQQRRLALAIQLVRRPALLLLDEPLAGLDWQSRSEVIAILEQLKERCTLLVVSHDLAEIAPLVDCAWRMKVGGTCESVPWPPADLAKLEQ